MRRVRRLVSGEMEVFQSESFVILGLRGVRDTTDHIAGIAGERWGSNASAERGKHASS